MRSDLRLHPDRLEFPTHEQGGLVRKGGRTLIQGRAAVLVDAVGPDPTLRIPHDQHHVRVPRQPPELTRRTLCGLLHGCLQPLIAAKRRLLP